MQLGAVDHVIDCPDTPSWGDSASLPFSVPPFLHDFQEEEFRDELEEGAVEGDTANGGVTGDGKKYLRVCDIINELASLGGSIHFDPATKTFTVIDGARFESEFLARKQLRAKKDQAPSRVFAQMYRTYTIVEGERWGASRTTFVAKSSNTPLPVTAASTDPGVQSSPTSPPPAQFEAGRGPSVSASSDPRSPQGPMTSADSVSVWITHSTGATEACSLQQFIDVTGLGQLYQWEPETQRNLSVRVLRVLRLTKGLSRAATKSRKRARGDNFEGGTEMSSLRDLLESTGTSRLDTPMMSSDVAEVLGGVWDATSKGDQAYFFKRKEGVTRFPNGAIVRLEGGVLVSCAAGSGGGGMHMVVSDLNAKWKGEPLPMTAAEEEAGHWCCFLGQVPVAVRGAVKTGDCIGPAPDGSGLGVVVVGERAGMVGIALADKAETEAGVVKTLCFAGLNALSAGDEGQRRLLDQVVGKAVRLEEQVEELREHAIAIEDKTDKVGRRVSALERAVDGVRLSRRQQCGIAMCLLLSCTGAVLLALLLPGGGGGEEGGAVDATQDGDADNKAIIVVPTLAAGFPYCCPPPCPEDVECPRSPVSQCLAWESFAGECPNVKCVEVTRDGAEPFCQGDTWAYDPDNWAAPGTG